MKEVIDHELLLSASEALHSELTMFGLAMSQGVDDGQPTPAMRRLVGEYSDRTGHWVPAYLRARRVGRMVTTNIGPNWRARTRMLPHSYPDMNVDQLLLSVVFSRVPEHQAKFGDDERTIVQEQDIPVEHDALLTELGVRSRTPFLNVGWNQVVEAMLRGEVQVGERAKS